MKFIRIRESMNDRKLASHYIEKVGSIDPINNVGYVSESEMDRLSPLNIKYGLIPIKELDIDVVIDCFIMNYKPHYLIDNLRCIVNPFRANFEDKGSLALSVLFEDPIDRSKIREIFTFINGVVQNIENSLDLDLEVGLGKVRAKYTQETLVNLEYKKNDSDSYDPNKEALYESLLVPLEVDISDENMLCVIPLEDDQLPILREGIKYVKHYNI